MTSKMNRSEKPMRQKWTMRARAVVGVVATALLLGLGAATPAYAAPGEDTRFANTAAGTARIVVENGVVVLRGSTMVIRDDTWMSSSDPVDVTVTVEVNNVLLPLDQDVYPVGKYGNTGQIKYSTGCNSDIGTITPGMRLDIVITESSVRGTKVDRATQVADDWVKWSPACPTSGPIFD